MREQLARLFDRETRPLQAYIVLMSVVASALATVIILLVKDSSQLDALGGVRPVHLALFTLLLLAYAIARNGALMGGVTLSERVMERTRINIANQIRQASLKQVEALDLAEIYVVMSRGSRSNQNGARAAGHTLQSFLVIAFCFAYLLWYSPVTAFAALAGMSLVLAIYEFYYRHVLYAEMHETYDMERQLFATIDRFFEGAKELKLDRRKSDDLFDNALRPVAGEAEQLRIGIERRFADNSIACGAVFFALVAGVVFVLSGYDPPDKILRVTTVVMFLWAPLQTLNVSVPHIFEAFVALDRNTRLERELRFGPVRERVHDRRHPQPRTFRSLEYHGLCFSHRDREGDALFAIGPLDLSIRPGEVLFVTGGNGSGKSTLIKVLCGLYPMEAGRFEIDGRAAPIEEHRDLFSAVFADFHLFERLYGIDGLDPARVEALIALMELDRVTGFDQDRFTSVDLSTGQRKRLALIASLLEDKPVLLFDEWAAEQAPHFRRYFYETLLPELRAAGKAVVAVSHDTRFLHVADRVLRLERGERAAVAVPPAAGA